MTSAGKVRYAMSKRLRNRLFAAVLISSLALILFDHLAGEKFRKSLPARIGLRGEDAKKYHQKTFRVIKIVDGDTLDIDIPDGKYQTTRIRLLGVDTPETKKPGESPMYFGPEAGTYVSKTALGQNVTIIIDTVSDVRDRYARLLAYIILPDSRVLNEELIINGYGYADLRFPHSDYEKYAALQESAIESKVGLWDQVTRDQIPKWLLRERPGILAK